MTTQTKAPITVTIEEKVFELEKLIESYNVILKQISNDLNDKQVETITDKLFDKIASNSSAFYSYTARRVFFHLRDDASPADTEKFFDELANSFARDTSSHGAMATAFVSKILNDPYAKELLVDEVLTTINQRLSEKEVGIKITL
jgi:uncharacterized membrane protein YheB (UPF0754 family)